MADFIFGKECKIVCYSLMTSGKVGSTAAFVFSETDGSVPVDCCYMSVECPFGSDMDVKAVPSCDFKKHFCRYFLTAQEFPFVFVELLMPSGFFFLSFLFFFSFPFQTLFFLPFAYVSRACTKGVESRPRALNTWTDKRGMIFPSSASFRMFSIQFLQ